MLRSTEELDVLYQKLIDVCGSDKNAVYRLLGHIQILEEALSKVGIKASIKEIYGCDNVIND